METGGKNHVRVLSELNVLGGIYDESYTSKNTHKNLKFYNSLPELIDNVNALVIASPANTHYEIAKEALKTIDVLIEKTNCNENLGCFIFAKT